MLYPLSYEGLCAYWKLLGAAGRARIQAYKLPGQPSNTDAGSTGRVATKAARHVGALALGWPA
ncbi:hypothetical protein [Arthrobacter sp. efr-133-TYG-118]|uniref:hypothetical protein n=1 Tax=Arthrobacter sp. efr-133-TYG-118 TaxID=3040279 RepID=UPI00254AD3CF|nr:hypothetical protein [Arthrobacter sp. efr-133-TYG-118]